MDSEYLKKNVMPALTEALGAMAIQVPDDQVEFLGRYLLSYVDRKENQAKQMNDLKDLESVLEGELLREQEKEKSEKEKRAPIEQMATQYQRLLESIPLQQSKAEAAEAVVNFLENNMNIPAAYYGVKITMGETEYIKYLAAGPASQVMLAFKVPEVQEEEPADDVEGGEQQKKGPPPLENVIVKNVMRNRHVKFFGIPKLGEFVVCPFKYLSYEHDGAVRFNPGDGAEVPASYELVKQDFSFLVAFDSVGKFRHFTTEEVERVSTIGKTMIQLFEKLESKAAEKQLDFIQGPVLQKLNDTVAEIVGKLPEEEVAALAAVQPQVVEGADPPPADPNEFIKPKVDSATIVSPWSKAIGSGPVGSQLNSLQDYLLPLPGGALKLFYAAALLLNFDPSLAQDIAGDISWDRFKKNILPTFASKVASYKADEQLTLAATVNQVSSIKAFIEANGLADTSIYPSFLPLFPNLLLPWLTKAIAARDAAITYATEVEKKSLEILQ